MRLSPSPPSLRLWSCPGAFAQQAPQYGPPKGTLVIVGGGSTEGTGIVEKFIALAGGVDKKFVIVPTAGGNRNTDGTVRPYDETQIVRRGSNAVSRTSRCCIPTTRRWPTRTPSPPFCGTPTPCGSMEARQWNIVDSYAGTLTYKEFHNVLARGGVIAGSSAGATIQGEYLVRGDTSGPNVVMTQEPTHQKGFEFLRRSAIDQHINARNRWDDLTP